MSYLWKVSCIKSTGKLTKGMEVEVVKSGSNSKPSIKEIGIAIQSKYGISLVPGCSLSNFDFELHK